MNHAARTWAVVLAAGEGSRLRSLTTTASGISIPKQFCSLWGGPTLLHDTMQRAAAVARPENICAVVAEDHRQWWSQSLQSLRPDNVIVQPMNRGTAIGILLPLLHILERDPQANVVLLPSDHYVRDESVMVDALNRAIEQLDSLHREVVLLGVTPEEADPELGYILSPAPSYTRAAPIETFIEKPSLEKAHALLRDGALWNVFILVARASVLLSLFESRMGPVVKEMRSAVRHDLDADSLQSAVARLYRRLPDVDFSRHIAQGSEPSLRVLQVPMCGWSDLGTPGRVAQTLRRTPSRARRNIADFAGIAAHINLAEQHRAARVQPVVQLV